MNSNQSGRETVPIFYGNSFLSRCVSESISSASERPEIYELYGALSKELKQKKMF